MERVILIPQISLWNVSDTPNTTIFHSEFLRESCPQICQKSQKRYVLQFKTAFYSKIILDFSAILGRLVLQ